MDSFLVESVSGLAVKNSPTAPSFDCRRRKETLFESLLKAPVNAKKKNWKGSGPREEWWILSVTRSVAHRRHRLGGG